MCPSRSVLTSGLFFIARVSARSFCTCKTRWIRAVNKATSEEVIGNCQHSERALGPGFIHCRKQKPFPPSIHRAETFIPPPVLAGSHSLPVSLPTPSAALPPCYLFFRNKNHQEPSSRLCI